ncbi:MAG: hypothetical protein RLZZ628_388 [Bacteroidota bacterium]|jgi:hypothetical protein
MYNYHTNATIASYTELAKLTGAKKIKSVLTLCGKLTPRNNKVELKIQKDGSTLLPGEKRLEMNDLFMAVAGQMTVRLFKTENGVTFPITDEMTYTPSKVFTGKTDKGVSVADCLRTVYDSELSFGTRTDVKLQPASSKVYYFTDEHAKTDNSRGFVYFDQPLRLSGRETDSFTLILPDYLQEGIDGAWDALGKPNPNVFAVVNINLLGHNATDAIK